MCFVSSLNSQIRTISISLFYTYVLSNKTFLSLRASDAQIIRLNDNFCHYIVENYKLSIKIE